MKHLGLFEGIGGFSLAASWMGWETVAWCEINEFCQKTLRYYFPNAEGYGDITKTDFTKYANTIDILTGGFPCQPFSQSGEQQGENDERYLFPEMFRAIWEIKPRWIVAENVYGITTKKFRELFQSICSSLEVEGYEVQPVIIPASSVGALHERYRVWIIAYSGMLNSDLPIQQRGQDKAENINAYREIESRITSNSDSQRLQEWISPGFRSLLETTATQSWSEFTRTFTEATWKEFPTQSPVFIRDDGLSSQLDGITVSKWREESCRATGNAIVPQVAYQIFKAIEQYENTNH